MQPPLSKHVFQTFKTFLQNDPNLLAKYVSAGLTVVDSAITPLNNLMKHLLVVQGINPNQVPGERQRRALEEALMESFNRLDDNDFDEDYDFTWVDNKFQKTREKLSNLDLTKKKFKDYTDVSNLQNPLGVSIASKYDSHTVVAPNNGFTAKIEDPIGEPHRKHEDRIRDTSPMEEHKFEDTLERMKRSRNEFEKNNPGVLEAAMSEGGFVDDSVSPTTLDDIISIQEAYDPRDPTLEKLEKLLKKVEARASASGLRRANLDGAVTSAKSQLRGILDARPELRDILDSLIGHGEIGDGSEEDCEPLTPKPKKTKKTANKASGYGTFRRAPNKKSKK